MKLRSVYLTNFRKFVGTYGVEGIGDGVNLLVGQNELGKSTLLEAINAVIFEKAKSQTELVKSFRHFVNGTVPEVKLTFDLDGNTWTIHKRFALQSGKAVLTSSDGRRFEDEAAELELQRLLGLGSRRGGSEPGIWGTLWVRQRLSFGEPGLSDAGRQTLRGCIEEQVGVVTGGERGRKIPLAVDQALGELVSTRGPRGGYKEAKDRLAEVITQSEQLAQKKAGIFRHMDNLSTRRRERREVEADWDEAAYRADLQEARDGHTAAATRAANLAAARSAAHLALERATADRDAVAGRQKLAAEVKPIEVEIAGLVEQLNGTLADHKAAVALVEAGSNQIARLRDSVRANGEQGRRLERVRAAISLSQEIARHEATLAKAVDLQAQSGRISTLLGEVVATEEAVTRIEVAETELSGANAALNAVATTVSLTIEPAALGLVRLDGAPLDLPTMCRAVLSRTTVGIEGIGSISIEPQIRGRDVIAERLRSAEGELRAALQAAGADTLRAARFALAQKRELQAQLMAIQREIVGLAPKDAANKLAAGLDSRQTRVMELRGRLKAELEVLGSATFPTAEDVALEIAETHQEAERLSIEIGLAEAALEGPRTALVQATATLQSLQQRLAGRRGTLEEKQASLAAGRAEVGDEELSARADELALAAATHAQLLRELEAGQGETVAVIEIRIKRLETAGRNHHEALVQLNNEITRLTALIEANEGMGIDEAFDVSLAEQSRLEAVARRYEEEVAVLQLLQKALRDAEREAKALYLAPVASRVAPYLRMLLPGTDLVLDENLSISAIERNGSAEAFGSLSDGTQEQLAVLTRLAFAELLMAQGHPATVILDDALAFSDDVRIERMFDILMHAGEQLQVLVLTCRKRLFGRLGARELSLQELTNPTADTRGTERTRSAGGG